MSTRSTIARLSISLVALLLLTACGGGGADGDGARDAAQRDDEAEPTTASEDADDEQDCEDAETSLTWGVAASSFGPGQAPYTSLPQALGFWEEEGLEVEVMGFAGSGATTQAVQAGQVDAGLASPTLLIPAVSEGADLVAYFNQITSNIFVPHVPEDSPVETVEDFAGATIGVQSLESSAIPLVKGMMDEAGVDPASAEFVAIGTGAEALSFVENGRVDVLGLFDTVYGELEALGLELRPVATESFEDLGFQQAIFTTQEWLDSERCAAIGVARGVAKSMAFAEANPEEAVELHWQVYPESKPSGVSDDEALAQAVRILERRNANTGPVDGVWGGATADGLGKVITFLEQAEVIDEEIDVAELWTDELLDEINDFDEDAVRDAAP